MTRSFPFPGVVPGHGGGIAFRPSHDNRIAFSGDNVAARNMAALRDARVLDGGTATLVDGWSQMVYRVGRDVRNAQEARSPA